MTTRLSESDADLRTRLPASAYDLAMRLGVKTQANSLSIKLTQSGRMKRKLESDSWMPFTASQTISTLDCEFDWRARMSAFGFISARDALIQGVGCLDVNALGFIPVARTPHTAALARGELLRYLAEIAWAPHAILCNRSLRWQDRGPDALAVTAGADETECTVLINLDSDGRIADVFAADRPRAATPPILATPWRGRFSDYRLHGQMWIPFGGAVGWVIDGKDVVYFECKLQRWEMLESPA